MATYTASDVCFGSGAVTFSHATLQYLLHNLCCDWQVSINLARPCCIIISPAIQLDSTQQGSWHCEPSQRKFPVSGLGGWLLLQWIFYGGACQYSAEYCVTDKHTLPQIWLCVIWGYMVWQRSKTYVSSIALPGIKTQWGKVLRMGCDRCSAKVISGCLPIACPDCKGITSPIT